MFICCNYSYKNHTCIQIDQSSLKTDIDMTVNPEYKFLINLFCVIVMHPVIEGYTQFQYVILYSNTNQ